MYKKYRLLRILEYIGTEEFIRDAIHKRSVKGKVDTKNGSIKEGFLGELTPEEWDNVEAYLSVDTMTDKKDREDV